MKEVITSLALGAGVLFATAASAAPLPNGLVALPDSNVENVRMVCNENGRCWRERGSRRVVVEDSYGYAPRERYIERRGTMTADTTTAVRASGSALGRAA
jgi:hypothetical protein